MDTDMILSIINEIITGKSLSDIKNKYKVTDEYIKNALRYTLHMLEKH